MDRKTKICIWVIVIGLANFIAYTIMYMFLGGEAVNGFVRIGLDGQPEYFLQSGQHSGEVPFGPQVSQALFVYSGIHSISIWLTVAAIMLAMLTLAKDGIVSSMQSAIINGRTFITVLATIIGFSMVVITIWFTLQFTQKLSHPLAPQDVPVPVHGVK